jgi:hypothetical protein
MSICPLSFQELKEEHHGSHKIEEEGEAVFFNLVTS